MAEDLKQRIQEDMKNAMRAREQLKLTTIRMLIAAVKQREIDDRTTLDDPSIINIINKMIKQRHDAAEQFSAAKRQELADKEIQEIDVLQAYLPEQLSEADIEAAIQKVITDIGATSMKDMGKVMGALKSQLEGRADMGAVGAKVKALLNPNQ